MTEHRNGGAAVVETLAAHGVDTIFGIPGTHNLEMYRHFGENGIRAITPRHEQGAGYAAEAYARVSGRPGVVVTTSGPGLTNAMTAAATAYAESQPVLLLSSGMPTGTEGRDLGQLHEAKNVSAAMDQLVRMEPAGAQRRRGCRRGQRGVRRLHRTPSPTGTHRDSGRRTGAGLDGRAPDRHAGARARRRPRRRSSCRRAARRRPTGR